VLIPLKVVQKPDGRSSKDLEGLQSRVNAYLENMREEMESRIAKLRQALMLDLDYATRRAYEERECLASKILSATTERDGHGLVQGAGATANPVPAGAPSQNPNHQPRRRQSQHSRALSDKHVSASLSEGKARSPVFDLYGTSLSISKRRTYFEQYYAQQSRTLTDMSRLQSSLSEMNTDSGNAKQFAVPLNPTLSGAAGEDGKFLMDETRLGPPTILMRPM
jgi:hypothetical protein